MFSLEKVRVAKMKALKVDVSVALFGRFLIGKVVS